MQALSLTFNKHKKSAQYLFYFVVFSLFIFAPSILGEPFWDDWAFIFRSVHKQMEASSPLIFFPGGSESKSWPIFFTALWGMLKLFKTRYFLYHLTSIFFHGVDGFLCWKVLRELRVKNALLLALLFLAHPLQLFTVSWIIQFKTVLSLFFFLLSLLFLIRFYKKETLNYYFLAIFFFGTSLLTKSTTVAFGLPLLLSYPLFKRKMTKKKFITLFVMPFVFMALVAALRTAWSFNVKYFLEEQAKSLGHSSLAQGFEEVYNLKESENPLRPGESPFFEMTVFDRAVLSSKVFLRYLGFIAFPVGGDYLFQEKTNLTFHSLEFLLIVAGLSSVYFLIYFLIKKKLYLELLGVAFFLASLLPFCGMIYVPIFSISNFVPYWLSIPFLGLLPLLSRLVRSPKVLIGIITVFALLTHWQVYEFVNVEDIFVESIKKTPDHRIFQIALIEHYTFTGQCEKARALYQDFKESDFSANFCLKIKTDTCKQRRE